MKKILTLLLFLGGSVEMYAAKQIPATGRVVDEQGAAVEYATVVLLEENRQTAGSVTDDQGSFTLKAPSGEYTLSIQYLGYETLTQSVRLTEGGSLGSFTLRASATEIDGVVVEAQLIRREADRFVVDVANAPSAVGKDGVELLAKSPGVWITDSDIQINGKSGAKIYVNGRELRMSAEQLLTYLRSLRTEDIQKIEVVPQSGADFDADSSGGIILITLRRPREDGMMGTVSFYTSQGKYGHDYSPNLNVNYHHNRLDLYASGWGWFANEKIRSAEQTRYASTDATLDANSRIEMQPRNYGGKIGGVYEIASRHNIGAEFEYWSNDYPMKTASLSDLSDNGTTTRADSRYRSSDISGHYSATFNYIYKLDTLGSTLKFLIDYTHRSEDSGNDMQTLTTVSGESRDSIYRDRTASRYDIAAATLALEKNLSEKWQVKAGVKYTHNGMYNNANYEYLCDGVWTPNTAQNRLLDYTERIAALYGTVTARLGRWNFVAGVRGEYTATEGKGIDRKYLSLFPNANLSYGVTADGSHTLIAQYSRSIARPSFWTLTPNRMQVSDYLYMIGNPDLDPSYTDQISATYVLKQKYSFTFGIELIHDNIQQLIRQSDENPDILYLTYYNYRTTNNYNFSANLPFQLTKWWSLNTRLHYSYYSQSIPLSSSTEYRHALYYSASSTFQLPRKFMIDVDYFGTNRVYSGNLATSPMHRLSVSVKKQLFDERLTLSVGADNILNERQEALTRSDDFTRTIHIRQAWNSINYTLRIAYNFRTGKAFNRRAVESGSGDEKGRLK